MAIFGQIGLKGIDTNTATALRAVIMAVFLFIVVLVQGKFNNFSTIIANKKALGFIALSVLQELCPGFFILSLLSSGRVQQVAPVDKLSVVFAILLAALFLGEKINPINGIGVALIAAASSWLPWPETYIGILNPRTNLYKTLKIARVYQLHHLRRQTNVRFRRLVIRFCGTVPVACAS